MPVNLVVLFQTNIEDTASVIHANQAVAVADTNQATNEFVFSDNDTIPGGDTGVAAHAVTGLFTGHELQPSVSNAMPIKQTTPDWLTGTLFLIIIFFAWLKVVNGKIIRQLFVAVTSNSVTNQVVRDENILVQRASVLLSLVFYFTGALFLYQISVFYNWDYKIISSGFPRFVIFVLFIASAYSFKMVFLKLMSIVVKMDRPISSYIFNIFLINNVVGIVFIPLVILVAFFPHCTEYFIWAGIGLMLAGFLYRIFRGIIIWTGVSRSSLYYLILYLCALEIAPLLIIFKLA